MFIASPASFDPAGGDPVSLLCKVEAADPHIIARDARGVVRRLAGVGLVRSKLRACPTRYTLDHATSAACLASVCDAAVFTPETIGSVRTPSTRFWVELWGGPDGSRPLRRGALVETDGGGRKGRLTCFHERPDGLADLIIMRLLFDLDKPARPKLHRGQITLRHREMAHLDGLFDAAVAEVHPSWRAHLDSFGKEAKRKMVEGLALVVWPYLPSVLMFSHLLANRRFAFAAPHGLSATGASVLATGQRPNDTIEVRLALDPIEHEPGGAIGGVRHASRQHQVRGHFVHRAGKRFWRTAHLRGVSNVAMPTRTVLVCSNPAKAGSLDPFRVAVPTREDLWTALLGSRMTSIDHLVV